MSIDVSDIVNDADLGGHEFVVIRQRRSVDADGFGGELTTQRIPCIGSIQPAGVAITGQPELFRNPDGERVVTAIKIWTTFNLIAGANNVTADVVWFQGQHYTVNAIDEFNFGAGYVAAMASIIEYHGESTARP